MKKLCAGMALLMAASIPSNADIISGVVTGGTAFTAGGTFVKLTVPLANPFGPPNSVGDDNFQSPNLYGFDEDQNILLTAPLRLTWVQARYRQEQLWRAITSSSTRDRRKRSLERSISTPRSSGY